MAESVDLAALLAHADWLRALARRLVAPASVDDAVQETYIAALRSPPDPGRPPRPWLARVLRNATRMEHRGATRRERREDVAAIGEPTTAPPPDDAVARAEAFRMLVELVLALDEPLRTTVVRHYFDGDKLADIARRDGVPEGTVRWRHKRALEVLRERLDQRSGGDHRAWLAALAPLATPPAQVAAASIGGLLVMKMTCAAVLAMFAAGGIAWRVAAAPAAAVGSIPRHVRRLADADERRVLVDQIARARARHRAAHFASPGSPGLASGDGDVDSDAVLAAMLEVTPFLRECYARAPVGDLLVHADLTLTGDPDVGTIIDPGPLLDDAQRPIAADLDDCIRATLQTLELPPIGDADSLAFTYTLELASDGSGSE